MKEIGGYFELELFARNENCTLQNCTPMNSARHSLEYILHHFIPNIDKVYIPYYTCEVVLEPLRRMNLAYEFYHVNDNLEIRDIPKLSSHDLIVVNNYFGIKDNYINSLVDVLENQIIVDNAQAFFYKNDFKLNSFYSPRKYLGVPDGGYAYTRNNQNISLDRDYSSGRCHHLIKRIEYGASESYQEFKDSENELSNVSMKRMSELTTHILRSVDPKSIIEKRRLNFNLMHEELHKWNLLSIPDTDTFACPMVYPFRCKNKDLRNILISNKIYVATYWPNVKEWCRPDSVEYKISEEIIPLPIDQRYSPADMKHIINLIKKHI